MVTTVLAGLDGPAAAGGSVERAAGQLRLQSPLERGWPGLIAPER